MRPQIQVPGNTKVNYFIKQLISTGIPRNLIPFNYIYITKLLNFVLL